MLRAGDDRVLLMPLCGDGCRLERGGVARLGGILGDAENVANEFGDAENLAILIELRHVPGNRPLLFGDLIAIGEVRLPNLYHPVLVM